METSQNLAIDSFSYHWLANRKLCFDSLSEQPLRESFAFLEEKPPEETIKSSHNSIFHFPISKPHTAIVHADEIFSHGFILPKFSERAKKEVFHHSYSVSSSPNISLLQRNHSPHGKVRVPFLRNWRNTSKKLLQKYISLFKPLCTETGPGCTEKSVRILDFDGTYRPTTNFNNSSQFTPPVGKINYVENSSESKRRTRKVKSMNTSPERSPFSYYDRSDLSMDFSIDEAILHCKESLNK